jgi:hypothetical protein
MLYKNSLPKDEVIEMIKRLHIPGYEIARRVLPQAIEEGVCESNGEEGFPNMSLMEAAIAWAKEAGRTPEKPWLRRP